MSYNNPPAPQDQNGHVFPPLVIKNADGTYTFVNATTGLPVSIDASTLAKEAKQDTGIARLTSILTALQGTITTSMAARTVTDYDAKFVTGSLSISEAINLNGLTPLRLIMPASWTAASITLQTSRDGVTWQDVYDQYGGLYVITTSASRNVILNPSELFGIRRLRFRSGTPSTPINQVDQTTLTLVAGNL